MALQVICPGCGKRYRVEERHAGRKMTCKACGAAVEVPAIETVEVLSAVAATAGAPALAVGGGAPDVVAYRTPGTESGPPALAPLASVAAVVAATYLILGWWFRLQEGVASAMRPRTMGGSWAMLAVCVVISVVMVALCVGIGFAGRWLARGSVPAMVTQLCIFGLVDLLVVLLMAVVVLIAGSRLAVETLAVALAALVLALVIYLMPVSLAIRVLIGRSRLGAVSASAARQAGGRAFEETFLLAVAAGLLMSDGLRIVLTGIASMRGLGGTGPWWFRFYGNFYRPYAAAWVFVIALLVAGAYVALMQMRGRTSAGWLRRVLLVIGVWAVVLLVVGVLPRVVGIWVL